MPSTPFIISVLWTALAFPAYYFLSRNQRLSLRIWKYQTHIHPNIKVVVVQRAWGLLFLGILSVLILLLSGGQPALFGLSFRFSNPVPWWSWMLLPLIIIGSYFQASSPGNLEQYPQVRIKNWSRSTLVISALSWMAFLLAYEFLFRGFLLFASLEVLDPWQAIALNTALYAFAHMYKGPGETFGAIPVGILLCYLTIETGNIWMALLFHVCMALSNEWFSLKAHPDMQLKAKDKR